MKNKKEEIEKKEIEKRIKIVKRAVKELRENPLLIKKMEKVLVC